MTRILMVASEAAPFVKTGGLADVLGGLPPALAALGERVAVLLPKYRSVELSQPERVYHDLPVWLAGRHYACSIDRSMHEGVPYFFLNCPPLFDREGIYNVGDVDYPDNHIRFAVLCKAAMETVRRLFRADVLHCHDWQASLLPVYLHRLALGDPTFIGLKTLLTIHNLGYQGRFAATQLADLGLDASLLRPDLLEFFGDINLLKGGIVFSDAINTVSRGYAREIQTPEFGFSLDGLLRARAPVLSGILNGVDYGTWSPDTDRFIAAHYRPTDLSGKAACKRALLDTMGLHGFPPDRPLIGIVSRFAPQKGFDLIAEVAPALMKEDVGFAVLGSGDPAYEELFRNLAAAHPDRVGVAIGYNNPLAHMIEAGADMFLMPSRYEPCGLNQIYSLRYGTVPIVRATGGLDDTIDEETGFKFHPYSGEALLSAVSAALAAFENRASWQQMMVRGMQKDLSWDASAREYAALYRQLLSGSGTRAA
jgi:starch synthase